MESLLNKIQHEIHNKIINSNCKTTDFKVIVSYTNFNEIIRYNYFKNRHQFNGKRKGHLFGVELLSSKDLNQDFILTDNENQF